MLVLSRKRGEIIDLPDLGVSFKIIAFKSAGIVSVGIDAPPGVRVHRREILEKIQSQEHQGHQEHNQEDHSFPPAATGPADSVRIWAKPRPVTGNKKSQTAGEQGGDRQS